jgi:hypothetical protein
MLGDAFQARATHAPHRAALRHLGLSVGIAIASSALAACQANRQDTGGEAPRVERPYGLHVWRDPETGCAYLIISEDYSNLARAALTPKLREDGKPDCAASGMEARQGGDANAAPSSDDSPTAEGGDAQ